MKPSWSAVRDWVFDLDNTLYPAASTIYDAVEARMTAYIAGALGVDGGEAAALRERYFHAYGATVVGLARYHRIDAHDFLETVHDVSFETLAPDEELTALIAALPGRKFVFTNGGASYARRVLDTLGLAPLMDGVCDIESAGLVAKPNQGAYDKLVAECGVEPAHAVLIDDQAHNLAPAHELGFATALVCPAHPDPKPAYVKYWAPDVRALLRDLGALA